MNGQNYSFSRNGSALIFNGFISFEMGVDINASYSQQFSGKVETERIINIYSFPMCQDRHSFLMDCFMR